MLTQHELKNAWNKIFTLIFAMTVGFASFAKAQDSPFDKDAAPWHKKAVMTCGMLRDAKTFDKGKMLKNLDELSTELGTLQTKYANNPPVEYSNDPLWKSYFEDFADNISVVKERVENGQYRLAQNYCGNFCRIFGRMHKNNGLTDLTDLMFSLRAEIRMDMDMFNAQNYKGAGDGAKLVRQLLSRVVKKTEVKNSKGFDLLFQPLASSAESWINALIDGDKKTAVESFDRFMGAFAKPYIATL